MSTIFGACIVLGVFTIAWLLFESEMLALFGALLTLVNHFVFVHGRLATLDVFMVGNPVIMLAGLAAVIH